jgi:chemotaxis protein MotB
MTLNLEAARKEAEDTLTLLAAAEAAKSALEGERTSALSDAERRAAELAQARSLLADQQQVSAEGQRQVALLNQQTAELRQQLNALQGLLDTARAEDEEAQVQIETLGANLNAALARVATEERARAEAESARAEAETARAELEARERARLAEEAKDLANYRSEFFGRMRAILGDRQGVQVVGDRFVFDSEVLFPPGSATLGPEGRAQVARVAEVIREVADEIPPEINWVLRVDGHTDRQPVSATSPFADNWELSQARALSVVRYMTETQGLPADRLAATGFGEFQPIDAGDTPEALARNRRIELKFTER